MSAHRKHIAKYTQQYRQLYPTASLLVLESSVADFVLRTNRTQHEAIRPARDVLLSHISSSSSDRVEHSVALHSFSNGGLQCATQLIASLPSEHRVQVFNAIVLDSCPGEATYHRSVHAMSLSLPKHPLSRIVGVPLVHLMICMFNIYFFLFQVENAVSRIRKQTNDPAMIALNVPRLYVYSKADQLVLEDDVASHVADARRKGYSKVQELLFESSAHCAHAMTHKEQYWKAVATIFGDRRS
ncbi:hypothetical protein WHR41_04085 [Cladosporium halotolerans]|uniref:Transmembrane protein 53 n=1 Tax=Cladosporium halotolerans TaxID=1052096 RepID=A0AB34KU12_9PEZI